MSCCCMEYTLHPNFSADSPMQHFRTTFINDSVPSQSDTVTDLFAIVSQSKYISTNNVVIIMSAYCTLYHLHESKYKFSVHNGVRGSRTFCQLCTAGQMSCGAWGCDFVLTQPAVGLLPELEMFSVCSFQMCRWWIWGQMM